MLLLLAGSCRAQVEEQVVTEVTTETSAPAALKLFLCGDVMTGRGIDQILPHSVDPVLYESYVKDARRYVELAERTNGRVEQPVGYDYIWGDARQVWEENDPDLRLINLETSVTTHDEPWPRKGIHYRMHPQNVDIFTAAGIDHCTLGNNHTLDWGRSGLLETMETLEVAGVAFSGVGRTAAMAAAPSVLSTTKGRVLVFSYASPTSGVPQSWTAEGDRSGVNFLPRLNELALARIRDTIEAYRTAGDIVVFSVHWGGNWGYDVPEERRAFARALIDTAGVDLVYGHSSHHPLGIEVYKNHLILYGAGDFINDYEGIGGREQYRGDLTLMYFPELDPRTGELRAMKMVPMQIRQLQLPRAPDAAEKWLQRTLNREGEVFGTGVRLGKEGYWLEW